MSMALKGANWYLLVTGLVEVDVLLARGLRPAEGMAHCLVDIFEVSQ